MRQSRSTVAIDIDSLDAGTHSNLGVAPRDNRQVAEAIKEFRRAIELDPKGQTAPTSAMPCMTTSNWRRRSRSVASPSTSTPSSPGPQQSGQRSVCQPASWTKRLSSTAAVELEPGQALFHLNLGICR